MERLFIPADSDLVAFPIGNAQIRMLGLAPLAWPCWALSARWAAAIRHAGHDIPFILRDFYGAVSILVALGWHALNQLGWQRPETEYALFAGLALRLGASARTALARAGRQRALSGTRPRNNASRAW